VKRTSDETPRYVVFSSLLQLPPSQDHILSHPALKHLQFIFIPSCERPRFTLIKTNKISVLYVLTFKFLEMRRKDKRLCNEW